MPLRLHSEMTPGELVAWRLRHKLSPVKAALALGITRRQFDRMAKGHSAITETVARLCAALDLIHDYESVDTFELTPRDLAKIWADATKRC